MFGYKGIMMLIYCNKIIDDGLNNVYVTGYTQGNLDGGGLLGTYDSFVICYDSDGEKIWTEQLGVSGSYTFGQSITTDSSNNVYVVGFTSGIFDPTSVSGTEDFFVTKYSSIGVLQWIRQLGASGEKTQGHGVTTDSLGNVYITGYTKGDLDGNALSGTAGQFFVTKYDSDGNKQWTQLRTGSSFSSGMGITTDSADGLFVTGYTGGSMGGNDPTGIQDIFLLKLPPNPL